MNLTDFTAVELGAHIRNREVSAPEALDAVYHAYQDCDECLNAYTDFAYDLAKKDAEYVQKRIDAGETDSILAGVPIGVKDNISTKGVFTTCASRILRGYRPPFDATAVQKVRQAGMVPAGKLNMDEFAMGSTSETSCYGAVRNPWNIAHVPGGSSGGAAAAVAAREAFCALGSDTGGSIRQPASYCGITGLKPSYGRVSRYGLIAYASSLDQIGPLARDVRDCAAILDVISGTDPMDSTSRAFAQSGYFAALTDHIKGLRVGMPEECFGEGVDDDVRKAVEQMAETLAGMGAELRPVQLPFLRYAVPTYYIIATAEASSNLSRFDGVKYGYRAAHTPTMEELFIRSRSEGFGAEVRKRILLGTFVLSSGYYDAYYNKALRMKEQIMSHFAHSFTECDVILSPVSPVTAPELGTSLSDSVKMYLSDIFTVSVNLAGLPGLTVPCGFDAQGLPIGAQLIAAQGQDQTVLNAGYAFQSVTDYHTRRPERFNTSSCRTSPGVNV